MSAWFDCADESQRADGIAAAVTAVLNGELVVLPTDTVYGLGADAFSPAAVTRLLTAKGRSRDMPPPVLVGTVRAATALVEDLGPDGQRLIDEFWPGGLTIVCRATRSLSWDLGDTKGTVAIRMPEDAVALDLLRETGPMAVSSANLTGLPAATTAVVAKDQLGDAVSVYLDNGTVPGGVASTIVDLTGPQPRLLRRGAISVGRLREVAAVVCGGRRGLAMSRGRRPAAGQRGAGRARRPGRPPSHPANTPASAMAARLVLYSGRDAPYTWFLPRGSGDPVRDYILTLLVTAAVTYLLTPLVRRLARPNWRHQGAAGTATSTSRPIPLLGGLAMYGGLAAGLLVADQIPQLREGFAQHRHDQRAAAGWRPAGHRRDRSMTAGA